MSPRRIPIERTRPTILQIVITQLVVNRRRAREIEQKLSFWEFTCAHPLFAISGAITLICWLFEAGILKY